MNHRRIFTAVLATTLMLGGGVGLVAVQAPDAESQQRIGETATEADIRMVEEALNG